MKGSRQEKWIKKSLKINGRFKVGYIDLGLLKHHHFGFYQGLWSNLCLHKSPLQHVDAFVIPPESRRSRQCHQHINVWLSLLSMLINHPISQCNQIPHLYEDLRVMSATVLNNHYGCPLILLVFHQRRVLKKLLEYWLS